MEPDTSSSFQQKDEISLKDLILKIQSLGRYLWKKWLIIVVCGFASAGIGLTYSLLKKPLYVAELTFVLEDSKQSSMSAYAGIASQFGIDLNGGAGSGVFSGENILEFLKSRLMVERTLLSPLLYKDKLVSLVDYYIIINNLEENWKNNPTLKNLNYPLGLDRKRFSRLQDSILNTIQEKIIKKNITITKPDKKLSFISVECRTEDEVFSKILTERLVKEATDFYIQTRSQRYKVAIDKLQSKADSIESLLNRKTYSVAVAQDMNLNPARRVAGVNTELVARDKTVLQTMYAEVIRNLEFSKMSMAQEMPVIQIVDAPIFPLKKEKLGKVKGIILGGFLGGLFIVTILLIGRIYKDIMF